MIVSKKKPIIGWFGLLFYSKKRIKAILEKEFPCKASDIKPGINKPIS